MIFFFRLIYKFIVYLYVNGIFSINTYTFINFSQRQKADLSYQKINLLRCCTDIKFNKILQIWLPVCNVFGFFLSHIDDISYKKVATQSHTYYGGAYYVANNAVDGDIATCMRTDTIGMNDLHKTVWWKVDLGGQRNIYSISILFKSYNGYGEYRLIIGVLCRLRLVLPLLSST